MFGASVVSDASPLKPISLELHIIYIPLKKKEIMTRVIIVLGDYVTKKGILSDEQKKRIDEGINQFYKKKATFILFGGGFGKHFNQTMKPLAEHMKKYALEQGIPAKNILVENYSFNTIENILFAKKILKAMRLTKIMIVSSDWHLPRVKLICKFLLEKKYTVSFKGVHVKKSDNPTILKWEVASRKRDKNFLATLLRIKSNNSFNSVPVPSRSRQL